MDFAIKNSLNFAGSVLGQMFTCKKDMFSRFLSNEDINWRQIVYSFNRRLLRRIAMRSDSVNSKDPRCLIADDNDFPKTGRKCEMGKKPAKPQGLSQKQLDARYSKECDTDSRAAKRSDEYFQSKMDNLIRMIKMSKTKYDTVDGVMTANAIMAKESKRKGHVKYSKHYRFYYCEVAATFAGTPVKLFFYRYGKKGDWNALPSTNTALNAYEAYKIYSMRWAIEVSFAEAFHFDQDEMMRAIINNNNKELNAVRRALEALQPAA